MTVSVATRAVEYQSKPEEYLATLTKQPLEDEITYDFAEIFRTGRQEELNTGTKPPQLDVSIVQLAGQRLHEMMAAKNYITSLATRIIVKVRSFEFSDLIKDPDGQWENITTYEKSATDKELIFCCEIMRILNEHFKEFVDNSDHIKKLLNMALLNKLVKKLSNATNELFNISPGYIQHLTYRRRFPVVFEMVASLMQQLQPLEPKLLNELYDTLINGDLEFFFAYHNEEGVFDDLRVFLLAVPNEIYDRIKIDLIAFTGHVLGKIK